MGDRILFHLWSEEKYIFTRGYATRENIYLFDHYPLCHLLQFYISISSYMYASNLTS